MKLHALTLLLLLATPALADTVVTRDGMVRVGTIESRNDQEVRLRIENDGISSTLVFPMSKVSRIILGGPKNPVALSTQPATPTLTATTTQPPSLNSSNAATTPAPASALPAPADSELAKYASRGFLSEMSASSVGHGLDDPDRLPAAQHELLDRATAADASGKKGETLDALRLLEAGMRDLPDGLSRIDGITRRLRGDSFGAWMGHIHWELINEKRSSGSFDLQDVRDVERQSLIGLMKGKSAEALEPLKPYFPPVDDKTGQPTPFKPAQLSGITFANATEVKGQAQLAVALLLGQLKLEPTMSPIDRGFLGQQLATVNRVLSRARDLEPQAKAALAREQQQQRIAADKAQRDAAIAARKTAAAK